MRLARPRLTVRRMMILVALAGLLLGELARLHRRREFALAMSKRHKDLCTTAIASHFARPDDRRFDRLADYHIAMAGKWWAAANRPGLPFEADPPEPE